MCPREVSKLRNSETWLCQLNAKTRNYPGIYVIARGLCTLNHFQDRNFREGAKPQIHILQASIPVTLTVLDSPSCEGDRGVAGRSLRLGRAVQLLLRHRCVG